MHKILILLLCLIFSSSTFAKVSPEQQRLLNQTLTPFGAERTGNGALIPEWTANTVFVDNQQPLYIITAQNYTNYETNLTAGQVALFKHYPESFTMPVYPSQRTFSAPDWVLQNTYKNAMTAELNSDGSGFSSALSGIPFPIPESALEVYFNHISRWRGKQLKNTASDAVVFKNGKYTLITRKSIVRFDFYNESNNKNNFISLISRVTAPARKAGSGILVLEPLDQLNNARSAWLWDKGRRRAIRAPNLAYDTPIQLADSLRTTDDTDLISGSPDRFNWQLLGKQEVYIPYNNNKLNNKNVRYKTLLQKHHINPEYTRFELHRVWVLRATLKKEWRHIYSQRDFYLDEDTWQVVIADQYNKAGELWRVSLSFSKYFPDMPGIFPVINVYHDLHNRKYSVMGLQNERKTKNEFNGEAVKDSLYTPSGLKRFLN